MDIHAQRTLVTGKVRPVKDAHTHPEAKSVIGMIEEYQTTKVQTSEKGQTTKVGVHAHKSRTATNIEI